MSYAACRAFFVGWLAPRLVGSLAQGHDVREGLCEKAGVEPTFSEHAGDDASALALVISLNVQRRDMTAGQKAIVAAKALEQMPERRGRPGKDGKSSHVLSRDLVAKQFKVSDKSVQQAKSLLANAADLAERVSLATAGPFAFKSPSRRADECLAGLSWFPPTLTPAENRPASGGFPCAVNQAPRSRLRR